METDLRQRIRERAYAIWLAEGCPDGRDGDHWLRAEREVAAPSLPVPDRIEVTAEGAAEVAAPTPAAARKPRTRKTPAAAVEVETPVAKRASPAKPRTRKKVEPTA